MIQDLIDKIARPRTRYARLIHEPRSRRDEWETPSWTYRPILKWKWPIEIVKKNPVIARAERMRARRVAESVELDCRDIMQ